MRKVIYLKAKPKKITGRKVKFFSLTLMIGGFTLIALALWPIISFNVIISKRFTAMVIPVPNEQLVTNPKRQGFSGIVEAQEENVGSTKSDYTKASIWFPKKPALKISQEDNVAYTLSVPKLKIIDAQVIVGAEDLSRSLIQYGGTAYPGDYGNAVIFGHSVLPYFFSPKDYKTIFSTLPNLSEGDEVIAKYQGITYRYVVEEMRVVGPDDVSILEQRYDDSYLSLITCVPPGTYEKRLWVKARLEKI